MKSTTALLTALLPVFVSSAVTLPDGRQLCPLKGQTFPAPTNLSDEPAFQKYLTSLSSTLNANLTQLPYNETTFSLSIFSATDPGLLWEYHHTDPLVKNSTLGTNDVDADSVYRIASISKVLTTYLWLIRDGDRRLNFPVGEFVPELERLREVNMMMGFAYALPDWEQVTVGDLMSYLAGIGRDYGLNDAAINDSLTEYLSADAVQSFESSTPPKTRPFCGFMKGYTYYGCDEENYLQGVSSLAAVFAPGLTPMYSNANFAILGYALANMLNQTMETIFNTSLVEALNLTGTTYTTPKTITEHAVIPKGNATYTSWDNELGPLAAAAGAFSTTNDLAKIGKAILNSTLTSKSVTRRWLSSVSFVDTIDQGAGRGWEIFRREVNGQTNDLYTKSGNWGAYTSLLILIPTYNIGLTLLTATRTAYGQVTASLPNTLIPPLLTVLQNITTTQASHAFAGTYTDPVSNSTLVLSTDSLPLGLNVSSYISHGAEYLTTVFGREDYIVDFRLVPNGLYDDKPGRVGFTAVYSLPEKPMQEGQFYWPCQNWLDVDDFTYGSVPLGQVVFEIDEKTGRACAVRLVALGVRMERVQMPSLEDFCDELETAKEDLKF